MTPARKAPHSCSARQLSCWSGPEAGHQDSFQDLDPERQVVYAAIQELLGTLRDSFSHPRQSWCDGTVPLTGDVDFFVSEGGQRRRFPLPLAPSDLHALKELDVMKKAPFGRGTETVIDDRVRSTWQIAPNDVLFTCATDKFLHSTVQDDICAAAAQLLGLAPSQALTAVPHKLLVYEKGDFFSEHLDNEKQCGDGAHIATLSLVLPSTYTGGEWKLGPSRGGYEREQTVCSASQLAVSLATCTWGRSPGSDHVSSSARLPWMVWFNDVPHQVLPVTSGTRVCLLYNLMTSSPTEARDSDTASAKALPVSRGLDIVREQWVPHLKVERGRFEAESEFDGRELYNHLPFAAIELDGRYSQAAWAAAGVGCLRALDRSVVETVLGIVRALEPSDADGSTALVAVLARVTTTFEADESGWAEDDTPDGSVVFDQPRLLAGSCGAQKLQDSVKVKLDGFSCLAMRCGQWTVKRYPVTDAPFSYENEWMLGGHPGDSKETVRVYGNDADSTLEIMKQQSGLTLLLGPPRHFVSASESAWPLANLSTSGAVQMIEV